MISERAFAHSFDSFWHELLPLLTPRFVAIFNQAYELPLLDDTGDRLTPIMIDPDVEHPDLVAEFAFRLAAVGQLLDLTPVQLAKSPAAMESAERQTLELIQKYEGNQPLNVTALSAAGREEGLRLCSRYAFLYGTFPEQPIVFCPRFSGAGFIDSSEGDIALGDTLVEVKTTTRRHSGRDLRQLLIYLALDAASARPQAAPRWTHIALFNPRRGTLHRAEVDALLLRLSGGKPRADVFADLIAFAESNEPTLEQRF